MIERTFTVQGMSDEDGEEIVERAFMSLDGVESAEADSMLDAVVVRFDPDKVTLRQMREILDLCGFDLD